MQVQEPEKARKKEQKYRPGKAGPASLKVHLKIGDWFHLLNNRANVIVLL